VSRRGAAGTSGASLLKKLGYAEGQRALLIGVERGPAELLGFSGFADRRILKGPAGLPAGPFDLIHMFETQATVLQAALPLLRARLDPGGVIWMSWPKKSAKLETTITEDVIRAAALAGDLVDVKMCAVDAVWSGLKLITRHAGK
jgi:hypothetical protein